MGQRSYQKFFLYGERLHPLWRIGIYLAALLAAEIALEIVLFVAYGALVSLARGPWWRTLAPLLAGEQPPLFFWGLSYLRLMAYTATTLLLGRFLDREPAVTMGLLPARTGRDVTVGLALGFGAMLAVGGVQLALGWAQVSRGTGAPVVFAADALALLAVAVSEEVVFRGYLLRALAAWRGPLVGVLATSVLFALVHSLNPNLNGLALLNLALAGVLLALAVERTGALWLAIAYHFAWNLTEGSILGMPVSGMAWNGLLTTIRPSGPALLTGGLFGPEGGLVATAILLLSLLPLWALTRRPAAVVASCRRQRAEVERRFGPLPTLHIRLDPGAGLFDEFRQGIRRGDRQGEVVLLLLRADGSCLLHTKSFYPDGAYRLPSGGIHLAESVLDAARRETAEETGLMLGALRPLGLLTYCLQHRAGTEATPLRPAPGGHGGPRPDGRRMFFHSWIVLGDVTGEAVASDAGEQISGFRWVPLTDLPSLATALLELAPPWDGWGRFRAPAHTAALQWL